MVTLAALLWWSLTLTLTPLFAFLALVTAAALGGGRRRRAEASIAPVRFLFVIPAHDEEAGIEATVASCRAVEYDPSAFSVVVIADNCTDATATAARAAGAEVVERFDADRRSKGYALEDFFRREVESEVPGRFDFDAAVIVDADTLVDRGLLARFAEAVAGGDDWAQAYYTVRNPDASWRTRLLTYAFSLFNGAWLLGQDRLGLGVGFRGNGMCLTARGLKRVPWHAAGLTEDQEFSWVLRVAGERVRFLPDARVYAEMVTRGREAVSQRRRWEEGRRALRAQFFGPLLGSRQLSVPHKTLLLIDLFFPPLTALVGGLFLAAIIHPAAWLIPALAPVSRPLLPIHLAMALVTLAYAASPFIALRLPLRYAASLAALPYYVAWKVVSASRARATGWVRTRRESEVSRGRA